MRRLVEKGQLRIATGESDDNDEMNEREHTFSDVARHSWSQIAAPSAGHPCCGGLLLLLLLMLLSMMMMHGRLRVVTRRSYFVRCALPQRAVALGLSLGLLLQSSFVQQDSGLLRHWRHSTTCNDVPGTVPSGDRSVQGRRL